MGMGGVAWSQPSVPRCLRRHARPHPSKPPCSLPPPFASREPPPPSAIGRKPRIPRCSSEPLAWRPRPAPPCLGYAQTRTGTGSCPVPARPRGRARPVVGASGGTWGGSERAAQFVPALQTPTQESTQRGASKSTRSSHPFSSLGLLVLLCLRVPRSLCKALCGVVLSCLLLCSHWWVH